MRITSLRALVAQDEMEDMFIGEDLLKRLGMDPHEILAARLEEGTMEAEIDATKMADKSAQRQKFSKIGTSKKRSRCWRRDEVRGSFTISRS